MRERLVGALVLLCIGVVLWSMLFTGTVEQKVDRRTQIPPPIVIDRPQEVEPRKPANVRPVPEQVRNPKPERVARVDDAPAPADDETSAESTETSQVKPQPEPVAAVKPEPEPAPPAPAAAPKKRPALDQDTRLPEAWVVQVGTFGQKANADTLKEKLQKDGHKAYLKNVKTKKGTLYRVLVGPVLVEAEAEKTRQAIADKYKIKPIVQRFER